MKCKICTRCTGYSTIPKRTNLPLDPHTKKILEEKRLNKESDNCVNCGCPRNFHY